MSARLALVVLVSVPTFLLVALIVVAVQQPGRRPRLGWLIKPTGPHMCAEG